MFDTSLKLNMYNTCIKSSLNHIMKSNNMIMLDMTMSMMQVEVKHLYQITVNNIYLWVYLSIMMICHNRNASCLIPQINMNLICITKVSWISPPRVSKEVKTGCMLLHCVIWHWEQIHTTLQSAFWDMRFFVGVQGARKRLVNLAKQDPGRARQKS